jgi:hypothetical protein
MQPDKIYPPVTPIIELHAIKQPKEANSTMPRQTIAFCEAQTGGN